MIALPPIPTHSPESILLALLLAVLGLVLIGLFT